MADESAASKFQNRRGVVRGSITSLGNRLSHLDAKQDADFKIPPPTYLST